MIPSLLAEFPECSRVRLCRLLNVSLSESYRKAKKEEPSLLMAIEKIVMAFLGYGYRRVHRELKAQGFETSRHHVRNLMREEGLGVRVRSRRPKSITKSALVPGSLENLLKQYEPTALGEIWVADMTLIRTGSGACYVAAILDAFSRRAVAWSLSRSPDLALALDCLEKALKKRKPVEGWIHHSDRGSTYTALGYQSMVRASGGRVSYSRPGKPTDNPQAESFFATLKKEEVRGNSYDSFLELEASLERYIDGNYNAVRMHSALGYLSPEQYEAQTGEAG